jgi:hypothetical protein
VPKVLDVGSAAIGSRYQWGGAGGRGQSVLNANTDCSGFVSWAYEQATGVRLPAQTQGIYQSTMAVSPKDAQPGDLVMFNMGQGANLEHVGIYAGNGMMLHDSSLNPNGGVDLTPMWSGAEFRRVPGVDPSLRSSAGNPSSAVGASGTPQDWVVMVHAGREYFYGKDPSGRAVVQDMGLATGKEGQILGSSAFGAGDQPQMGMGSGGEAGMGAGDQWYDDPTIDQPASDAQINAAQINQILATPGMGYQVPTTADVYNAVPALDPYAQQAALPPAALTETGAQANTDIGRAILTPPEGMQGDPNRRPILAPPTEPAPSGVQIGPITLPGTAPPGAPPRRAINLPPQPAQPPAAADQAAGEDQAQGPPPSPAPESEPSAEQPADQPNVFQQAGQAVQNKATDALRTLAPGLLKPETQQAIHTAATVAEDIQNPLKTLPGIAASVDYVKNNGFDPQPALDKVMKVEPGSATDAMVKKATSGQQADLATGVGFGVEALGKLNDFRADLVKAAQPPAIRDTAEGNAFAQGVALATDPLNVVGLPEISRGAKIVEGAADLAPKAVRTVEELTGAGLETRAARLALAEPVSARQSIDALQHASLALNDAHLAADAQAVKDLGLQNLKYEPLSGEQVRRTIVQAVVRSDPSAPVERVAAKADRILQSAGLDHLTSDAIRTADVPRHLPGLAEARSAWASTPQEIAAHVADMLGSRVGTAAQPVLSGQPAQALLPFALKTGIGGGLGLAEGYTHVDPNDPNREAKLYTSALLGAMAGLGAPYLAGMAWKGFDGTVLNMARDIFAPTMNLSRDAQDAIRTWAGEYALGSTGGQRLTDQMQGIFGNLGDKGWMGLAQYIEEHNALPFRYRNDADAQAFLRKWQQVAQWAVKHDVVPNEINFKLGGAGGPQQYVPHAVESAMDDAIQLGRSAVKQRPGRTAVNPFDYYNQPRVYQTLREGLANGVRYDANIPRVWGNYYSTAAKRRANASLVDNLLNLAQRNNPSLVSPRSLQAAVLKGEDIVRLGPGMSIKDLGPGARDLGSIIPEFRGKDIFVSPQLGTVLNNLFRETSWFDKYSALSGMADMGSLFKHNVLSGSLFHLVNETRQMFTTQGLSTPKNLWTMFKDMTFPGTASRFWGEPQNAALARQAVRDGLNLNMAVDRPGMTWPTRLVTAGLNTMGGAATGYTAASAQQMPEEQKREWALKGALAGFLTSVPLGLGPEARSLVEHVSSAMWNRYIPYMKLTTYQMYAPQFGGRAAADFANSVYGGQNLLNIARSKTVQDAMRIAILAPDWQEGWARQVGNALFDWKGPQGQMNRIYWRNALVQSAVVLEGLNYALSGHSTLQNAPDATMLVDMTRLYDAAGWDHRDPKTGQPYTPYLDILGPYRAMAEPLLQTARWATATAASHYGIDPSRLPLGPEVAGSFGKVPEPDPKTAWGNFLSTRVGWLPTTGVELWSNQDWAGRPVDQPGDSLGQQITNRVSQAMAHMLPTGESQLLTSGTRGDPAPMAVLGAITGMRTRRESDTNHYFQFLDQYVRDLGKTASDWQKKQTDRTADNQAISTQMEELQSGTGKAASMTAAQREQAMVDLSKQRVTTHTSLSRLMDEAHLSPEERQKYATQLSWLDNQTTVGGSDAPADLLGRPELDKEELFRLAWNRDPNQIAELQGQAAPPEGLGAQALNVVETALQQRPGATSTKDLASLRQRWTQETAALWGVDPAVMEDMVKAHLYQLPDGQPPALPGVTSAQLDDITSNWEGVARGPDGNQLPGAEAALARQQYLFETASQLGVDEQALAQRVKLRTLPMTDQTDAGVQRSQALDLLNSSKAYPYVDEQGNPLGGPSQWKINDAKLLRADPNHWKTSGGVSVYFNADGSINEDITRTKAAKDRATAQRYAEIIKSPNRDAYERWFGDGRDMTDAQWQQYQAGTLPMWDDNPSPQEAQKRNGALRLQKALTPADRLRYPGSVTWTGQDVYGNTTTQKTPLAEYLRYLTRHKSKEWQAVGMDPSQLPGVSSEG